MLDYGMLQWLLNFHSQHKIQCKIYTAPGSHNNEKLVF